MVVLVAWHLVRQLSGKKMVFTIEFAWKLFSSIEPAGWMNYLEQTGRVLRKAVARQLIGCLFLADTDLESTRAGATSLRLAMHFVGRSTMYQRILIATDGRRDISRSAVTSAIELASVVRAELVALYVVPFCYF
jgi:hypothetical protein